MNASRSVTKIIYALVTEKKDVSMNLAANIWVCETGIENNSFRSREVNNVDMDDIIELNISMQKKEKHAIFKR